MRIPSPKNSPQIVRMESTLPLHDYIYKNDVKNVKMHIAKHNDINATDSKGRTALFLASSFNRYELIEVLLAPGCDPNVADLLGNTPLHEAAEKGNTDIVRMLAKHLECDLDARNNDGETPLMKAAYYDYGEIARTLLKEGANPDAADDSGQTPLLIALREASHVTVDHLLKHGCDVSVTDNLGHSALYIAIHSTCNKSLDLAKTLLGSGYDISQDNEWLLHEEKHNLFYQDDEFYNRLCRILTHGDVRRNVRSYSTNDATPPSSPALRLRRAATVTLTDQQSPSLVRKSSNSSPFIMRKISDIANTSSSPISTVSQITYTPPGSPVVAGRKISQTSTIMSPNQNEAPKSPLIRTRRLTPCPPPTENMLGSPKLAPKLRLNSLVSSSPTVTRRKTSQTSPLAKGNGSPLSSTSYSPLSSPESSTPSSPLAQRKVSQTSPTEKLSESSLVLGDLIKNIHKTDDHGDQSENMDSKKASPVKETLSSDITANKIPSPSVKRIVKQGSLDSITPPGSPMYRRQISVKFDMKNDTSEKCNKNIQRQTSVPIKNSVQFSANVQIIEVPHRSTEN